jgi:hypothetical protein
MLTAIPLLNPSNRILSYHGLVHGGVAEKIAVDGIPPENPRLAGEPLRYPWIHQALAAAGSRLTNQSPYRVFAAMNIVALAVTLLLLYRAGRLLSRDPSAQILGVVLALYAQTPFLRGPVGVTLNHALSPALRIAPEGNAVALVAKYSNVNPMPIGIAAASGLLVALLGIVGASDRARRRVVGSRIALAVAVGGLLYPPMLPAAAAAIAAAASVCALRPELRWAILPTIGGAAVGATPAVLYVLTLIDPSGAGSRYHLVNSFGPFVSAAAGTALAVGPLGLVVWLGRSDTGDCSSDNRTAGMIMGAIAIAALLMRVLVEFPMGTGYKVLSMAVMAVGVAAGPAAARLLHRHFVVSMIGLAVLSMPFATDFLFKVAFNRARQPLVVEHGRWVDPFARSEARLAHWIREETRKDAVLIDDRDLLPVATGRSLYVAVDPRPGRRAGWGMSHVSYLTGTEGHDLAMVSERQARTRRMVRARHPLEQDISAVSSELPGRPILLVLRGSAAESEARSHLNGLEPVYSADGISVFQVTGARAAQ